MGAAAGRPFGEFIICSASIKRIGLCPRNEWAIMLDKEARKMCADPSAIIHDQFLWKRAVVAYCST